MKKYISILSIILLTLIAISCGDSAINQTSVAVTPPEITAEDQIIFGQFGPNCAPIGSEDYWEICIETFKLQNDSIYEDYNDNFDAFFSDTLAVYDWGEINTFGYADDYVYSINNLEKYEDEIWSIPSKIFGCPECKRTGGFYLRIIEDGKMRTFLIERDMLYSEELSELEEVPDFLIDIFREISQIIFFIHETG